MVRRRAGFATQEIVPYCEIWGMDEKKPMRKASVFPWILQAGPLRQEGR
jgi:hypothetical protein